MSLDNIILPGILLPDLYKKALLNSTAERVSAGPPKDSSIAFLGNNQQHIAVIVDSTEAIYLPDEELNFLLGILTACKLSMAHIALLNLAGNPSLDYTRITGQLAAEKIFMFGLKPGALNLPLQFPHYQVQRYNEQVYLSAPSLADLEKDKSEKTKLWTCLKQVFSIG